MESAREEAYPTTGESKDTHDVLQLVVVDCVIDKQTKKQMYQQIKMKYCREAVNRVPTKLFFFFSLIQKIFPD